MSLLDVFKPKQPVANAGTSDGAKAGWVTRRAFGIGDSVIVKEHAKHGLGSNTGQVSGFAIDKENQGAGASGGPIGLPFIGAKTEGVIVGGKKLSTDNVLPAISEKQYNDSTLEAYELARSASTPAEHAKAAKALRWVAEYDTAFGHHKAASKAKAAASKADKMAIANSGTSEGALLGWETRRNGASSERLGGATQARIRAREATGAERLKHADKASSHADAASEAANAIGTKSAHEDAEEAHVQAGMAHSYVMEGKPSGDEDAKASATKLAAHQAKADEHRKAAKAILPPESPETIKTALDAQGAGHNALATKLMHETKFQKPPGQYTQQDYASSVERVRLEQAKAREARLAKLKATGGYLPGDAIPTKKEYAEASEKLGGESRQDELTGQIEVYLEPTAYKRYEHVPVTLTDGPSKGKTVVFQATPDNIYDKKLGRSVPKLRMARFSKTVD